MRGINAAARLLAALIVLGPLAGCKGPAERRAPEAVMTEMPSVQVQWPYWPQRMRIHPLTRPILDADGRIRAIEARIEFFDVHGDTTKACGLFRIDLHAAGAARSDEPIELWTVDLSDRAFNLERFDVVTRTYLFLLELDPDFVMPPEPELRAYYRTGRGDSLPMDVVRLRTR